MVGFYSTNIGKKKENFSTPIIFFSYISFRQICYYFSGLTQIRLKRANFTKIYRLQAKDKQIICLQLKSYQQEKCEGYSCKINRKLVYSNDGEQ